MSITEYERHRINQWLEEAMGPERAAIMMQLLPPVGWGDIATKADLQTLRAEMHALDAGLRGEMAELRGDMRSLGADLREQQAATLRAMVVTMVASHATLVGLVLAAVNLG